MMKAHVPQTYENHRTYDPTFLTACLLCCAALLVFAASFAPGFFGVASVTLMRVSLFLLLICAPIMLIKIRMYPLKLQDRIIRLEMQVRLRQVLPRDDHWQIRGLSIPQLIGLRFASDEELPALVRTVLDEGIADRDAIKRLIKTWTADHDRI